jgi:hypothetical protein
LQKYLGNFKKIVLPLLRFFTRFYLRQMTRLNGKTDEVTVKKQFIGKRCFRS